MARKYPHAIVPGYTHLRRAQAGAVGALPARLFRNVRARSRTAEPGPRARGRNAARIGRAGRQRLSVRPRADRPRPGLRRHHAQQHGCFGRSRFRARFSLCRIHHDAALEPPGRRLDSLFERRVRLAGIGRRRHQRVQPDAAEEESRFARADSRQERPRVRRSSPRCSSP